MDSISYSDHGMACTDYTSENKFTILLFGGNKRDIFAKFCNTFTQISIEFKHNSQVINNNHRSNNSNAIVYDNNTIMEITQSWK